MVRLSLCECVPDCDGNTFLTGNTFHGQKCPREIGIRLDQYRLDGTVLGGRDLLSLPFHAPTIVNPVLGT